MPKKSPKISKKCFLHRSCVSRYESEKKINLLLYFIPRKNSQILLLLVEISRSNKDISGLRYVTSPYLFELHPSQKKKVPLPSLCCVTYCQQEIILPDGGSKKKIELF